MLIDEGARLLLVLLDALSVVDGALIGGGTIVTDVDGERMVNGEGDETAAGTVSMGIWDIPIWLVAVIISIKGPPSTAGTERMLPGASRPSRSPGPRNGGRRRAAR